MIQDTTQQVTANTQQAVDRMSQTTLHNEVKKCPLSEMGLKNNGCLTDKCYYNNGIDCYCALEY